jgi:predicted oxidoreductase (fatty acid repression mutant protein)
MLWNDVILNTLRPMVPQDKFGRTEKKLQGFANGHGTVLFFLDEAVAEKYRKNMPLYAENVEPWQTEHLGMLSLSTWLLLCEAGYAATIQHYNPIIDDEVKKRWNIDENWRLLGQMPFGVAQETPGQKPNVAIEEKFFCFKD